ncbi:MAG: GAF domain-containing protein [Magnetococcales bacterium]|nr:GAF domain-containing protein [Magnetococcales bacterium]
MSWSVAGCHEPSASLLPLPMAPMPPISLLNRLAALTLPFRPVALLELGLFILMVLVGDRFFGAGDRLLTLSPHPFWLIILLLASQYGTLTGVGATLICTAALYTGQLPAQHMTEDLLEYGYRLSRAPLLWLVTAVLFGEIRMRFARRMEQAIQERSAAIQELERLTAAHNRLKKQKNHLEEQVASQMHSLATTYQAARSIRRRSHADVTTSAAEMIKQVLNPGSFSIFDVNNDRLVASITVDWSDESTLDKQFDSHSPLYQAIVAKRKLLCVAHREDRPFLEGQGVLAAPLLDSASDDVIGMVKIERMNFLDINPHTLSNFASMCEWISAAYQRASRHETLRSFRHFNPDSQLHSYSFLEKQTEFLLQLGRRVGFDVFLILMRLEGGEDLPNAIRVGIPRLVSQALGRALRKTDISFDHETPGSSFAVLLPNTPAKNVYIVQEKLRTQLDKELTIHSATARFSFTIQNIYQTEEPRVANR